MNENNVTNKNKLIKIGLISFAGSLPFFLGIFTVFVAVFLVLGLFEFNENGSSGSSISGSYLYDSGCNFEETTVTVMDGSNTKVLATVSLEDYIIGVACGELGACRGSVSNMVKEKKEHYIKTNYIVSKTYVLYRGKYNSTTKSITIRASTRDQLWCDIDEGCVMTVEKYTNAYPGNYPKEEMIGTVSDASRRWYTDEDLKILRQYYQDTYGELFLPDTYDSVITTLSSDAAIAYKSSTHNFWKQESINGKTYSEILEATGSATGVSDTNYYKNKSIYKLRNYCKATNISTIDYINWMINFANDNTHGYSMDNRKMDPDVDCSSFVYYALLHNGYTKDEIGSYPFTTATMEKILISNGFEKLSYDINLLEEGDIVWYPKGFMNKKYGHTEVYIGNGQTVGAHGNLDGKTGDGSGKEVSVVNVSRDYKAIFRKKT